MGIDSGFGMLEGDTVISCSGDMFCDHEPDGKRFSLSEVALQYPVPRTAIILGMWNNFDAVREKQHLPKPKHPWYFIKAPSCLLKPEGLIVQPRTYHGPVIYEAELAVVIGRDAFEIAVEDAVRYIFGYTAINDITAVKIIREEDGYEQWCRSKSFDSFAPCGPSINTEFQPENQSIRAIVNGEERQSYTVDEMIFSPLELVSYLSHCQTLRAGDVIACGTSLGARSMKDQDHVEVVIDGLRPLGNIFSSHG
tara:strand:- start:202 stop:957 length:756 start_codon:yes stop_codon:yes gene_type:complete